MRLLTIIGFSLALAAATASAQVPAGGEFQVNAYTTDAQGRGRAFSDAEGNTVVVWSSRGQDGSNSGVFFRRLDRTGAPVGGDFQANVYTTLSQINPWIDGTDDGRFVVVWQGVTTGDPSYNVLGRRFDRGGAPLGAEFLVNTYTTENQGHARVSLSAGGSFVVVWAGSDAGYNSGIFGQRYDAAGARVGGEFRINTYTTDQQDWPNVSHDAAGGFTVVWRSDQSNELPPISVMGRRYDASGQPVTGEFEIAGHLLITYPSLAVRADGGFVVTWDEPGASATRVMARIHGPQGPAGAPFAVSTSQGLNNFYSFIAADAKGDFSVVWRSYAAGGGSWDVHGRRFAADGLPRGSEMRVNTYTLGGEYPTSVASDPQGNFIVVWDSIAGFDANVHAQRFGGLLPAAMAVNTSGNGVLEPGESVDVRPSWRNVNGAPQTFASNAIALTGPAGAAYTIADGAAAYGMVPNGATQQCTDCLGVAISNPPARPATHWDATLEEKITPDAQGQDKLWALHVGNSFTDVPASSSFYRFVETLLHNGVTAGCTANTYCPASSATRDQMAVFVLVAKEGPAFAPPSCTTPVFADVPAASPFCRWIEELARRGVVSGCGGANYCPSQAVSREQMAVFVLRTLDPALDPPACTTPVFADVPASSPFCRWIEELARRGIVAGCGGGNYCPGDPVTREQMSVFIGVTFGLMLYGP